MSEPNEMDYTVWDSVNAYSEGMLAQTGGMGIFHIARELEPVKSMLANERQFAAQATAAYRESIEAPLKARIEELEAHKRRAEIYLEALEWIEDHNIPCWDDKGKPVSPGSVAMSAREKARMELFNA